MDGLIGWSWWLTALQATPVNCASPDLPNGTSRKGRPSPACPSAGLMSFEPQLLIGRDRSINRIYPSKEPSHRWQQLFLELGDLLFPIEVIDPGPGDQKPFGGVGGEQPLHGPITKLHQGDRILRTEPNSLGSHTELTPSGAATGRLQDCSASQGASPSAYAR
jgi:hypothetical protein